MRTDIRTLALTAIAALAISTQAHADSMVIAAGEVAGGRSTFGTVGGITALPGSRIGKGWVARVFAEELTYRYKSAAGTKIDATSGGGMISAGYQFSGKNGWAGIYVGPGFRYTHLSPKDPTSDADGTQVTARLQMEGEAYVSKDFKVNLTSDLSAFGNGAYWVRGRPLFRLEDDKAFIGPEFVYQGDEDYTAWQAGIGIVEYPITESSSLGFMAGLRKVENFETGPYATIEFGMAFE